MGEGRAIPPALTTLSFKKPWFITLPDFQTFLRPCTVVVSYVCFCWCSKQLQWPLVITVYQNIHSLSSQHDYHPFKKNLFHMTIGLVNLVDFKNDCNLYKKTRKKCQHFKPVLPLGHGIGMQVTVRQCH